MEKEVKVRKRAVVSDADILRLNGIGLRLGTIAKMLGCTSITVTNRLKALGVAPCDTRRSFMDDVYSALTPEQQEWLGNYLFVNEATAKDLVIQLIQHAYESQPENPATPTPVEEIEAALEADEEPEEATDEDEEEVSETQSLFNVS